MNAVSLVAAGRVSRGCLFQNPLLGNRFCLRQGRRGSYELCTRHNTASARTSACDALRRCVIRTSMRAATHGHAWTHRRRRVAERRSNKRGGYRVSAAVVQFLGQRGHIAGTFSTPPRGSEPIFGQAADACSEKSSRKCYEGKEARPRGDSTLLRTRSRSAAGCKAARAGRAPHNSSAAPCCGVASAGAVILPYMLTVERCTIGRRAGGQRRRRGHRRRGHRTFLSKGPRDWG